MTRRVTRTAVAVSILAAAIGASAAAQTIDLDAIAGRASLEKRLEALASSARDAVDDGLADYSSAIEAAPFDVVLQIERCRFLESAAAQFEYTEWVDEYFELADDCVQDLSRRYADHPEQRLFTLERSFGEQRLATGKSWLPEARAPRWTPAQVARLNALLAEAADAADSPDAALYARRALELDQSADVRLIVAADAIARGARDDAVKILTSPFDRHGADDSWYVVARMRLLAEADAGSAVVELYESLDAGVYYDRLGAVDALLRVGAREQARTELDRLAEDWSHTSEDEQRRFHFELDYGSPQDALTAYTALRDLGWTEDPLGILRVSLLARDPWLPWAVRDLLGLVGILLTAAGFAAICAMPVALVHYRGLARRARAAAPYPDSGWRLRLAWLAMFLFALASMASLYTAGPFDLFVPDGQWQPGLTPPRMARLAIFESLLALTFLLPVALSVHRVQPKWWGDAWSLPRCLLIGAAVAIGLRVPLLTIVLINPNLAEAVAPQDDLWGALGSVRDERGLTAALWIVAVVAPVVEELLFRGVVLRAFAQHVSFWAANVLQSAMFAAIHLDLAAAPWLFVLGMAAGSLARRSGGLAAPMALHAVFNLIAALILLV